MVLAAFVAAAGFAPLSACSEKTEETSYDISVVYDGDGTLSGTERVTYYNDTGDSLSELKFNLYANAYRQDALYKPVSETHRTKAYYNGTSYGNIDILTVTGGGSWQVCGEDENILSVALNGALAAGNSVTLDIEYKITLAEVEHRTGVCKSSVNLGNFYPVLCAYKDGAFYECIYYSDGDPFLSECADYTVTVDMPEGYTCASSGMAAYDKTANGRRICRYELANARDFALVLSDKFNVISREAEGVTVSYYYYDDDNAEAKLTAAADSLSYFTSCFGAYVYPTLAVVQTGFVIGGMEYPALTMINDDLSSDEAILTIVHENAHQWWYAMVGSNQISDAWQDEGLAEYSTALFFENNSGYPYTLTGLVNSATSAYRAYYTVYNQIFGNADTTMSRSLKDFVSVYEYVNIAYNKSMIMFNYLRQSVGDDKFFGALQSYYDSNIYKIAAPQNLLDCFYSTGVDLESFFDSFLNGKVVI